MSDKLRPNMSNSSESNIAESVLIHARDWTNCR